MRQFVLLVLLVCLTTTSLGFLSPILLNTALHLPLLSSGTVGILGTTLTALGALKLGNLALLYAENAGLGGPLDSLGLEVAKQKSDTGRQRRSDVSIAPDKEALYKLVNSLDIYSCAKRLICELKTKPDDEVTEDESVFLFPFHSITPGSPLPGPGLVEYHKAALLGLQGKSVKLCQESYSSCPFPGSTLMSAMRETGLTKEGPKFNGWD